MARTSVPRYIEIERSLREQIAASSPGDPLPSDAELCARFDVSRMTARQAVASLAAEGLVDRRPGRGTFVASPQLHRRMGTLLSFSDEMRLRGVRPSSRLLEAALTPADAREREALDLDADADVVVILRVRLAAEVPVAIERAALTPDYAPVLEADLVDGSLHEAMRALGRAPVAARASLTARPATQDEAALLGIGVSAALLIEKRVITDGGGLPVELTETRYCGDRYVFDLDLHSVTPG